jgi:molecular chaperone DnaK (HSP70)
VLRIINEPTAACLAYEAAHKHGARTILAFDLGGGTFDVSIVRMEGDVVGVIASHGDNQLGGDDFDAAVSAAVVDRLYARQEQPTRLTPVSLMRLNRAAETAKAHLSDQTFARLLEDQLTTERGSAERVDEEITRLAFEELLAPFLSRMTEVIAECPRCGCDLSTLRAGQSAARSWFDAGKTALREERFDDARAAFGRAWRWRHDAATARGLAVAALGLGCFAEALRCREQASRAE